MGDNLEDSIKYFRSADSISGPGAALNQDEPSHTQVATKKKLLKSFLLILPLPTALMTNSLIDNRRNLLTIVLQLPLPPDGLFDYRWQMSAMLSLL